MTAVAGAVITGIGAVTPIGTGVTGLWEGIRARRSAVRAVTRFDTTPFRTRIAAEVPDFRPQDFVEERRVKRLDRCSQFALAASRLALTDAELDLAREDRERIGAMMGTALGGVGHAEAQHEAFLRGGVANYVGTYWPVGDDPAKLFAERFYKGLMNGQSIGAALVASRKAVWETGSVDWADYIHYGSHDFMLKIR